MISAGQCFIEFSHLFFWNFWTGRHRNHVALCSRAWLTHIPDDNDDADDDDYDNNDDVEHDHYSSVKALRGFFLNTSLK